MVLRSVAGARCDSLKHVPCRARGVQLGRIVCRRDRPSKLTSVILSGLPGVPYVEPVTVSPRLTGHILLAEDDRALAEILSEHLSALGHRVTSVADGRAALAALSVEPFDVALLDIVMPAPDGLEVLRALADDPDPPAVIIATGQGTIDSAVHAMRLGAFAYLAKPYRMAELDLVISRALEHRILANQNVTLRVQVARAEGAPELLTHYAPLRAVFAVAFAAADRDTPILIVGAQGTGKCALAHAMHMRSGRAARPFVQLDAAALVRPDADRLLFGAPRTPGVPPTRAALATRGTLYLHDLAAMPLALQAGVARALRDARFATVGSGDERAVRARVIAAVTDVAARDTNAVSAELMDVLGGTKIVLPSLQERVVDIPLLAESFLDTAGAATGMRIDADAMAVLQDYAWPGNVAELRAVIERARLLARGNVIRATDVALVGSGYDLQLADVERRHIAAVLHAKEWHQGKAAESLGISPKTLYRKIREYGLRRPSGEVGT